MIDARELGSLVDRTHREFGTDDIARVAHTYHAWRGEKDAGRYQDVLGFCSSRSSDELLEHRIMLTPGRYTGSALTAVDVQPVAEKLRALTEQVIDALDRSARLDQALRQQLGTLSD